MTIDELKKQLQETLSQNNLAKDINMFDESTKETIKKEQNSLNNALLNMTAKLEHTERKIIIDKYINGLSTIELSLKYCYSYNYIKQKLNRTFKKMVK